MCKVFSSSYSSAESSYTAGSDGEESACDAGDPGSITGSGRSPGEGNGNLLWYSCLENSIDRGAWWATVHGIAESQTRLSDSHHTQFSCEVGQSLDPVPPARGVLSSARCVLIVKPQSQTQALVTHAPKHGATKDVLFTSLRISAFNNLKDRTQTGWESHVTAFQVLETQETRLEAERTAVSLTSPPRRRFQTRKIFWDEKKASQQEHSLLKIKSIISLKGRGFPETSLFFSTSKLSALSICYFSHWGKSILKRNSLAFMRNNKW